MKLYAVTLLYTRRVWFMHFGLRQFCVAVKHRDPHRALYHARAKVEASKDLRGLTLHSKIVDEMPLDFMRQVVSKNP